MSTKHSIKAKKFLQQVHSSQWHNETLWLVRKKRDIQAMDIPEWEQLREIASQIKLHTMTHWDTYLEMFEKNAIQNGVYVHWAKDADEHNKIVYQILQKHKANKLVKSKSMLTEECHLNSFLIDHNIEVIESDLGERILQLKNENPSHIVMPAIHLTRQQVGKLFEEKLHTEKDNSDPTYLTRAARKSLRETFLSTEVGMTGANFAVADTGDIVVCTNEGNADMGTSFQKVHIVSMGMEKLVPNHASLAVFTRLLARSATGQPSTSYTSHFRKPQEGAEMHIIIVDNGRSKIIGDPQHYQSLKCIRCAACMNTCPVYRRSGGFSYTYFIPGPIGINLGMLKSPTKYYDNVSACSLCYSCNSVCPVKIDLADQIYQWRQNLDTLKVVDKKKKIISKILRFIFAYPSLFRNTLKIAPLINGFISNWGRGRILPKFAPQSFATMWQKNKVKNK